MGLVAGAAAAAIALAAGATSAFRAFEAGTADLRLRAEAGLAGAAPDSTIVLVDIDNGSLRWARETLGRWPWPRDAHAAILETIALGRPRAIAYDILFAEPDRASPDGDEALRAATAAVSAPVVHAALFERRAGAAPGLPAGLAAYALPLDAPPELAPRRSAATAPLAPLLAASDGVGAINRSPDPDGVERAEPLLVGHAGRAFPSLPLALQLGGRGGYGRLDLRDGELHLDGRPLPMERGRLRVHWRGRYADRPYPVIPAHEVLRAYSAIATGADPPLDPAVFAGRTVIVGTSATGVGDLLASPFGPTEPGFLLHASILDTLARRDFLRAPPGLLAALLIAAVALAAGLVVASARSARRGGLALGALAVGWTALAVAAFAAGWILPWAGPVLAILVAGGAASAGRWLTEGRRHRATRRAFAKFLPPDVVESIASDRGFERWVERRELTVLFADVRGFTSVAEEVGPERTVETLNELFAELVDAVFRHGGTLDKFLGDGLMAIFGAPVPQADHAARACRAALEMLARVDGLNQGWADRGRPTLALGVGVHTGDAIVGFVGHAERRLDYTAIGDTVNVASRVQDLTKELGVRALVSGATAERAGGEVAVRALGSRTLRGRRDPVAVFALEPTGPPRPAPALESGAGEP